MLDGIGNGVQVLQAANTGITSLQSLVASAQSVANQVLQTPIGYDTKSSIASTAITGATANNLLGTGAAATSGSVTAGAFTTLDVAGTASTGSTATTATAFTGTTPSALDVSSGSVSFNLNVDGTSHTITINAAAVSTYNTNTTSTLVATSLSAADVAKLVDYQFGGGTGATTPSVPASVVGGVLKIASSASAGTGSDVIITGYANTANAGSPGLANYSSTGAAAVAPTTADSQVFTVTVDGAAAKTITLSAATVSAYNTAKSATLSASSLSAANVASIVNYQYDNTGATSVASVASSKLVFTSSTTGTGSTVATSAVTGTATSGTTGVAASTGTAGAAATNALSGETLTIGATGNGTATTITFGTATGQISTLNDLNTALSADNLQATIDTTGVLTITTSNNAASSTARRHHRDQRHRCDRVGHLRCRYADRRRGRRSERPGHPIRPGRSVQQHPEADRHYGAGLLVQRHQPA